MPVNFSDNQPYRFFARVLVFLFPIIALAVLLEIQLRGLPSLLKQKAEWMEANAEKVEVLVLGSSHSFYCVNASSLSANGYNLAAPSQGLEEDAYLVKHYLPRMKSLKWVVIPISSFSFDYSLAEGMEAWRTKSYSQFYGYPNGQKSFELELLKLNGSNSLRRLILHYTGSFRDTCNSSGGGNRVECNPLDTAMALGVAKKHSERNARIRNNNVKALSSIANAIGQEANIVVFIPPGSTAYNKNIKPFATETKLIIDSIFAQNRMQFLDLSTSLPDSNFFDPDHVCTKGQIIVTNRLKEIIH